VAIEVAAIRVVRLLSQATNTERDRSSSRVNSMIGEVLFACFGCGDVYSMSGRAVGLNAAHHM